MSNFETKELTGSLFTNAKKEKPNHPDYQGKTMIEGKLYYVSGWIKSSKDGKGKFLSLSYKIATSTPEDKKNEMGF